MYCILSYFILQYRILVLMNSIYILSGANLGNPLEQLFQASILLQDRIGDIVSASSIYESEGWGVEHQPLFYNQALIIHTDLDKQSCLTRCQQIETELGRVRTVKWGARIIDLDILYFNEDIYQSENLTIPHPLLQFRNFVLVPLCEIAPDYIHPVLKKSTQELLVDCKDELSVKKLVP